MTRCLTFARALKPNAHNTAVFTSRPGLNRPAADASYTFHGVLFKGGEMHPDLTTGFSCSTSHKIN